MNERRKIVIGEELDAVIRQNLEMLGYGDQ